MKNFSFACLSALLLITASCKKGSDPQPTATPTKTDHLVASSWKLDAAGIDQDKNGTIEISVVGLISSCTVDNTLSFKRDNTGITDESATKCNTADPQTTAFNWTFADAEASINISNSVLTQINGKSKVLELNATALTLSKDTTATGLGNVALVVKLKH